MQPVEPAKEPIATGDAVVVKRTNDRGEVIKTEEGRAVVKLETRTGDEQLVTADFDELRRNAEAKTTNPPG